MKYQVGRLSYWLIWPALWAYMPFTRRTRVILRLPDGRVLFVKGTLSDGRWGLPGGGVGHGETVELAAIREVFEETGIHLQPEQLHQIYNGLNHSRHGIRYQAVYYLVDLPEELPVTMQKYEVIEAAWLPPALTKGLGQTAERLMASLDDRR